MGAVGLRSGAGGHGGICGALIMADVIELRAGGKMDARLHRDTLILEVRRRGVITLYDLYATARDGRAVVLERFVDAEKDRRDGQI